jgi:hypothetical protein
MLFATDLTVLCAGRCNVAKCFFNATGIHIASNVTCVARLLIMQGWASLCPVVFVE